MVLRLQVKMALDGQTKQMEKNLYILMICFYFKNKEHNILHEYRQNNKEVFYVE